jgi:hypothetical protein
MHSGDQYSSGPDLAKAPGRAAPARHARIDVSQESPAAPASRRWWIASAWIGVGLALCALLFRISLSVPANADGANNALQSWDMLHGNLLLHSWILSDAAFYTFEVPLYAVTEIFTGLHTVSIHLGAALTYLIVVASAVAVARTGSRGLSTAIRCGVVIAVLATPLLTSPGIGFVLENPNHTGTVAIILVSFLLIDRAPGWRFTPPLLCAILIAGQVGDATVRFAAVPAVLVVCAYRVLATVKIRRGVNLRERVNLRTGDAAIAVAAVASVPLASLARAAIVHFGGYAIHPPNSVIAPPGFWGHHAVLALQDILSLYGAVTLGAVVGTAGAVFGLVCLMAAAFGFAKVIFTWRTASRAEQLMCVVIVINVTTFVISSIPVPGNAWEIVAVLPCGAVLAARALVPGHIADARRAQVAIAAVAVLALLPLAASATVPPAPSYTVRLATWLEAHRLAYGVAGYWDASSVTVQSGGRVQVRAITLANPAGQPWLGPFDWETNASWYDASRHDATFIIADPRDTAPSPNQNFTVTQLEKYFPHPVATYHVAGRVILIYRTNLLTRLAPGEP